MNKTTQELIDEIKLQGYNVKVSHFRIDTSGNRVIVCHTSKFRYKYGKNPELKTKGGATIVKASKGAASYEFVAECSNQDNFSYKLGLRIALNRAYYHIKYRKEVMSNFNIVEEL